MTSARSLARRLVATLCAAVLTVGAVALRADPALAAAASAWPQNGYSTGNTFYNPDEPVINASTVNALSVRWSVDIADGGEYCTHSQSVPIVADGRVFVSDSIGLHAFNASTGAHLWDFDYGTFPPTTDTVAVRLAVSGNVLLAAVGNCSSIGYGGTLYGVDVATGSQLLNTWIGSSPGTMVVDKGIAVIGGFDGSSEVALAFRISDGQRLWIRIGYWLAADATAGGRLLLTRYDGKGSIGVNLVTGAQVWKSAKPLRAIAANTAGNTFYAQGSKEALVAIKATTGAQVWSVPKAAGHISTDGRRIFVARGKSIAAYDPAKGKRLWNKPQPGVVGQPVRAGGLLITDLYRKPAAVLDPVTGAKIPAKLGALARHVVVVNGHLYATDGWTVSAYTP